MSVSKRLECFIIHFNEWLKSIPPPYTPEKCEEIGIIKTLERDIIKAITDSLTGNDGNTFNNNIANNIDVNRNELSPFVKNAFATADYMPEPCKKIICDFLDIILDDNYALTSPTKDYLNVKIYFNKIAIPVLFKWRNITDIKYANDIKNMNVLTNKYGFQFNHFEINNYIFKITHNIIMHQPQDDKVIFDIIASLKNANKEYIKFEKYQEKIDSHISKKDFCVKCKVNDANPGYKICQKCYDLVIQKDRESFIMVTPQSKTAVPKKEICSKCKTNDANAGYEKRNKNSCRYYFTNTQKSSND